MPELRFELRIFACRWIYECDALPLGNPGKFASMLVSAFSNIYTQSRSSMHMRGVQGLKDAQWKQCASGAGLPCIEAQSRAAAYSLFFQPEIQVPVVVCSRVSRHALSFKIWRTLASSHSVLPQKPQLA